MVAKPKNKKRWILIILVIAIVALGVYRIVESSRPVPVAEMKPVNVTVQTVEYGSVQATSPLTGRIDPVESASVVPLTAGEVTSLSVSLGDEVKKGDVLFELDKTQMATSYQQAKLAYNSAKTEYDRVSVLYKEGAVSQQQYQGAKTQLDVAKQSMTAASEALSYCTVTSPINGFVTSVNVSVGSLASQAMPAVTVADTSALEINTTISEYLISKLHVGDPVNIAIKSIASEPFAGVLTALSPAPAVGTLTYPATITVTSTDSAIKAGMFAEVQIVSEKKEHVLCIPSEAVFIRSGESKVVVVQGTVPELVTVTTGLDNGTLVEIIDGLKEGDQIVTVGQQYVIEGEAVNIVTE